MSDPQDAPPPARHPLSRRDLLVSGLAAALVLAFNLAWVHRDLGLLHAPEDVLEGDHHRYLAMAQARAGEPADQRTREAPFCWRILAPWLVSRLVAAGAGAEVSFFALSLVSLLVFLSALYLHLRQLGLGEAPALLGLALAGLLPGGVRWYLYQYPMPDPVCLALVALAFVAIETRRDAWLIPLGMAALATRESYLLVLPYHFLHRWRRESLGAALCAVALYQTLPLAVLVGIRLAVEPAAGYDILAIALDGARFRWRRLWVNQAYFTTVGTFGALLLPALLLLPSRLLRALPRHLPELSVIAGAYASLLLANNTDRLLVYALPALLPAALSQLVAYGTAARVHLAVSAPALLALQLYLYDQTLYFQKLGASIFQPARPGAVAAAAALWALAQARRWQVQRRERRSAASRAEEGGR